MTTFTFALANGAPPHAVAVQVSGRKTLTVPGDQPLPLNKIHGASHASFIGFAADDAGHWGAKVATATLGTGAVHIIFQSLPPPQPPLWWHELHMGTTLATLGAKMRIGVIDEALEHPAPSSCIAHIENIGGAGYLKPNNPRAFKPNTYHSIAVCSLLGSRADPNVGCRGIVPDADIVFASAAGDKTTELSLGRVASCIAYLSEEKACDLITVSAGDCKDELPAIEEAVHDALEVGTLCFFAAGNYGAVHHPARYPECLAVAALGCAGYAPPGSDIEYVDRTESRVVLGAREYLWTNSGCGPEVDFCAGGVGLIWNHDGVPARAECGTSFASPIATGAAALILSRDSQYVGMSRNELRSARGLQILRQSCKPLGTGNELNYWTYGRLWVP